MDDLLANLNAAAINYRLYEDVCYATRLLHAAEALLDENDRLQEESRERERMYVEWLLKEHTFSPDHIRSLMGLPPAQVPEAFAGPLVDRAYVASSSPYTLDSLPLRLF